MFSLIMAAMAHADFYKCEDASGRTIFSDRPCGNNASLIETNSANTSSETNGTTAPVKTEYGDRPDLLVCSGGHGTTLPAKLCDPSNPNNCLFRFEYLKNVITDAETLKNDISDSQISLVEKNIKSGDELWEFGTPGNEWDGGTGIRGYVVLRKLKATFYLAVLHQGVPNKSPAGGVRYLPLKGRPKSCENRNIMNVE